MLVLSAAVISWLSTSYHWDGGFWPACYHIRFKGADGQPLPGVRLRLLGPTREYRDWHKPLAGGWPVFEYGDEPLESNTEGEMVFHQVEHGLQFGGMGYELFWVIPIRHHAPDFRCEFLKPGYQTLAVPFAEFNSAARDPSRVSSQDAAIGPAGRQVPVVRFEFVLASE